MRIPTEAKPHEVAIIIFHCKGYSPKQIASALHYKHPQPVYRVLAEYKEYFSSTEETCTSSTTIFTA